MTFYHKYKENKKMIQLYIDFLPYVTKPLQQLKLVNEIGNLLYENELIQIMPVEKFRTDMLDTKKRVEQSL